MKVAADFRDTARAVLNRKWKIAVLVGLIATLLGAVEDMGPEVKVNIDASSANASIQFAGQTFESFEMIMFEHNSSIIFLKKIYEFEQDDDVLTYDFICNFNLKDNGSVVLPYWIREDGKAIWDSFFGSKSFLG